MTLVLSMATVNVGLRLVHESLSARVDHYGVRERTVHEREVRFACEGVHECWTPLGVVEKRDGTAYCLAGLYGIAPGDLDLQ